MLGFNDFFVICWLFFSKLTFSQNSSRNTFRESNGLDPNQDRYSIGPDLSYQQTTKWQIVWKEFTLSGIILAQNEDGPLKWTISHSNTCKFPNFNGPFEIFMGP